MVGAGPLQAAPALPTSFYGTVQIDGAPAPIGATIFAWINGAQIATTTVFDASGTAVYRIDVLGDDPDTATIEGGVAGDMITFQVAGAMATQNATWERGGYQNLDLTEGQGNNTNYRVIDFAQVRLTDYQLPGQNRISAQFVETVSCADQIQGSQFEMMETSGQVDSVEEVDSQTYGQ